MNVKIRQKSGCAILDLEGNIDINSSELVEKTGGLLNNKEANIIFNLGKVNLIDYVGISLIAVVYKNVLNHKGNMKLYDVPIHIQKLFSIVGMDKIFEYHASEEEAIEALKADKNIDKILKKKLRRRFKRVTLNIDLEYKPRFCDNNIFYQGKIVNLSAEGAFITTNRLFSLGELLTLRIYMGQDRPPLSLEAKVVWLTDKVIQPKYFPGMGLEFYKIDLDKQKKIIQFVEKHLASSL